MADNKKSFIAYCDWMETFEALPDDKAGQLAKHLFRYVNDLNPETDDILIKAVFANIKHTLKRDLKKYEKLREKRAEAGKQGGRPKKQTEAKKANGLFEKQTEAKKADSVNVSDSVSVSDINKFNFKKELIKLGVEEKIASDWLKVRAKKKASNTETAFSRIKSEIELCKLSPNDCIKLAVENSWQGFKAEWCDKYHSLNKNLPTNSLKGENLPKHLDGFVV